ncbi:hypothetical protein SU69_00685 [Thermosipho melanesiensis]|uniref:Fibronectin, type III domain protein n=2 Tax=Thermosipho melanesiensis TaxID=46541 RepID=A6LJA1_THEM4|nr:hypothetical protein [Thermosipho melanesiensis]ABR30002.1 hypothetical protein Tmel_0125 [Thermosipho melanesiensis BI429]APT73206.1 hypothetical protein BW47_00705 [Thermosipho melanesiensis]OOC38600.1 hypothetical protein SU68_00685 [Thermosipho melanesiensis]OOC40404.1 hypothetical protein SU70_00685 [Thermosipho melanesiensis]OOC40668.1 hypothetical protein SU69_00685 [Thermosipho melanesiensis]
MENKKELFIYLGFLVLILISIVLVVKLTQVEEPEISLLPPKIDSRNVVLKWNIKYKRDITFLSEVFLNDKKVYEGIDQEYKLLLKPGTYFWKVGLRFGNDYLETSQSSFTILNDIPKILNAKNVVDGQNVIFSWNVEDEDKTRCILYLSDGESEKTIDVENNTYEMLLSYGNYFWKVICEDEYGAKAESKLMEFKVIPKKVNFEIVEDKKGYLVRYENLDGAEYFLEIDNREIKLPPREYRLKIIPNVEHKLRLKVVFQTGDIIYSDYKIIYKKNNPPKLNVISPQNKLKGVVNSIVFKWEIEDEDRVLSTIYLGTSPQKLVPVVENYKATVYEVRNLKPNSKYYWKIKVNDGVNSVETPIYEFSTSPAIKILNVIGSKFDDYVYGYEYIDGEYIFGREGEKYFVLKDGIKFYIDDMPVDVKKKDGLTFLLSNSKDNIVLYALKGDVILWKKAYGGKFKDRAKKLLVENDGILVFGDTWSNDFLDIYGWSDIFLMKLDTNGNVIWKRNFGGRFLDEAVSISKYKDGYVILGNTFEKNKDLLVMYVDFSGKLKWVKFFGESDNELAKKILVKNDKIYVLSNVYFDKRRKITNDLNVYVLILNERGEKIEDYILGGSGDDICNDILIDGENIYLFGKTLSKDGDFVSYNNQKGYVDFFVSNLDNWAFVGGGYDFDEIKRAIKIGDKIRFVGETRSVNGLFEKHFGGLDIFIGELER